MSTGVSGCTSCQLGSIEALKAYDRAFEARKAIAFNAQSQAIEMHAKALEVNQPIAGAMIGSQINVSV